MAGRGPAPARSRCRTPVPTRGEWKPAAGEGWQHGETPSAHASEEQGLLAESLSVWRSWMGSWVATNWGPHDLAGLRMMIRLYDLAIKYVEDPMSWRQNDDGTWVGARKPNPVPDLIRFMDTYGITPKGQQDRRWLRPEPDAKPAAKRTPSRYGHLKVAQ